MNYSNWRSGDFHGYLEHRLDLGDGVTIVIVEPKQAAPGLPWYWRARFYGAFPTPDLALLALGWHVAHITIEDLYGNAEALKRMDYLFNFMVQNNFSAYPLLVGYSRGGLAVYNWARQNIGKFCGLYLDNAVCDFKSWPGGLGQGQCNQENWSKCLLAYGLTPETALTYPGNPIDNLQTLAQAKVPILQLISDADEIVVPSENTLKAIQILQANQANLTVIHRPGQGHHPHALSDPAPIVEFVLQSWQKCAKI